MSLHDPVVAYRGANNVDAHLVRMALNNSGIAAYVTENVSEFVVGPVFATEAPQVWVDRADLDRAAPIVAAYEWRAVELMPADPRPDPAAGAIVAVCDTCRQPTAFPVTQQGSVQRCGHCGAYVDVVDAAAITVGPAEDKISDETDRE